MNIHSVHQGYYNWLTAKVFCQCGIDHNVAEDENQGTQHYPLFNCRSCGAPYALRGEGTE